MVCSTRYMALSQEDEEVIDPYKSLMTFGSDPGTFKSAFTYADYNDLENMGYEEPKKYQNKYKKKYSKFTYTHMFNTEEAEVAPMNAIELFIYGISVLLTALTLPFSLLFVLKFVSNSERLVVLRLGRAQKTRGPGATWVIPCIDSTHKISTSITAFNVPPLQVITQDRGLVELGATVFLKVRDPKLAVCGVEDRNNSTRTVANTMLYRYISKKRITELTNIHDRRILAENLKEELGSFTNQYGVEITNVELSDMKVMKEGESMGLSALSAVARSDTGKEIWKVIEPVVTDFARETAERKAFENGGSEGSSLSDVSPGLDQDTLITALNMAMDEHLVRAVGKVFQVNCSGMEPMYIDMRHSRGSCARGTAPNPDVTFATTQVVFFQLIKKTISPINAYMDGSLRIKGSVQDALMLKYLAERVAEIL